MGSHATADKHPRDPHALGRWFLRHNWRSRTFRTLSAFSVVVGVVAQILAGVAPSEFWWVASWVVGAVLATLSAIFWEFALRKCEAAASADRDEYEVSRLQQFRSATKGALTPIALALLELGSSHDELDTTRILARVPTIVVNGIAELLGDLNGKTLRSAYYSLESASGKNGW